MANNDVDNPGPSGFRRVVESLRNAFMGTNTGPLISAGTNAEGGGPGLPVVEMLRLKGRSHDPVIKSRQESTKEKLAVWDNEIRQYVDRSIQNAFHPENYARMRWVMHTSSNVLRRVVSDVSVLYQRPAKRKLEVEETPIGPPPVDGQPTDPGEGALPAKLPAKPISGKPPAEDNQTDPQQSDLPDAAPTDPTTLNTGDPDIDALADVLELTGAKQGAEKTAFDKLMEAYDFDTLLDLVEKLTCICPVVWVRPMVSYKKGPTGENDASTGKLSFVLYTPDTADVVPDPEDPTKAMAFYYYGREWTANGERTIVHFFNDTNYIKFDTEWKTLEVKPHELGRLPVTVFRQQLPRNGYYCDGVGNDLFEATVEICVLKTLQNSRCKDGAFKQLAIQGDAKDIPQDLVMGGPAPIVLGDENTATLLDMQPNLEQFTSMWERREISLASTYGISAAEYKHEGVPQSGFAKKLDMRKVMDESVRRRKFFAAGEQDLYENLVATLKVNPLPGIEGLDPTGKLIVDFSEPDFEDEPNIQARTDAIELKFNAKSIIDILRRKNPDLNDVELIKMAYKNKRINDAFMTTDQMKLADLLATRANVGGSFGSVGNAAGAGDPGADGQPNGDPTGGAP